ncbi:Hypothetical protein SRAE_X000077600 [Strongyloides ratti]|uniref:Uncharacterized protein n=1 Tax=Strongyloides ratti TaxID=34506 RepID=A0A090LNV6_STRRB|nr:Hypothetical protein SRAE_X000077600 [Strongyloides ratti]CEF71451.1 Hypothetical protein SRAE_X000077600 [Strongyloides ratti]
MKRNKLSNNFRKHLVSSSRFWVGKRMDSNKKNTVKYSKQNDIAKNIMLWGKRDLDNDIDNDVSFRLLFDQY